MKTKNINQVVIIFFILLFLGFSFLTLAQNNSNSNQNIFLDSDQDGLSDEEEKIYGTDPNNADTDNDGYGDGTEIKSGYNPLKPSPGDKIIITLEETNVAEQNDSTNLTKKLAGEILAMTENSESEDDINLEAIQAMVDETLNLNSTETEEEFTPKIFEEDIKIKEQNYSHFSEEKQQEKRKQDVIEYVSSIYYILASNSPEPITSGSNINTVINSLTQQMTQAFTQRSTQKIQNLKESGEKILDQAKEIEVPEELVDIHINALSFAMYAIEMERYILPNPTDPITDIQNLSGISGLITNLISFTSDIEAKLSEYNISYEDDLKDKIEDLGLTAL